jgi:hypothetical protein
MVYCNFIKQPMERNVTLVVHLLLLLLAHELDKVSSQRAKRQNTGFVMHPPRRSRYGPGNVQLVSLRALVAITTSTMIPEETGLPWEARRCFR